MNETNEFLVDLNYIDTSVFTTAEPNSVLLKPGEYFGYEPSGENDRLLSELTGAKARRKVTIRDARSLKLLDVPRLNKCGFELFTDNLGGLASNLYKASDLNLENSGKYVDQIEDLIKSSIETNLKINAKVVAVFDLAKRSSGTSKDQAKPLSFIHSDYTNTSGVQRLEQQAFSNKDTLAPVSFIPLQSRFQNLDELKKYTSRKSRFLIVNVWRNADPSGSPILQHPLAVCDPRTVLKESLVSYEIRCPRGLSLYEYHISGGKGDEDCKNHEWYFYSRMSINECLMWISHDSYGIFQSVPHTSFTLPNNMKSERKSIEARAFVFLDELA